MYTGMLTVQSIPMAIQYYRVFQKLKKQGVHNLNVTTIFSYQDNEVIDDTMDEQTRRDILEGIIQTYNETFDKISQRKRLMVTSMMYQTVSKRITRSKIRYSYCCRYVLNRL